MEIKQSYSWDIKKVKISLLSVSFERKQRSVKAKERRRCVGLDKCGR